MSAKVRVPFLRQVVPISKKVRKEQRAGTSLEKGLNKTFIISVLFPKVARDPRFDDLSGEYNPEIFDKTYQFLNDIRAKEKEVCDMTLVYPLSGTETGVHMGQLGRAMGSKLFLL